MGDLADELVDRMSGVGRWGHGWGFGDFGRSEPPRQAPKCKHCGSTDVDWVHTGVRWRLYDTDLKNPHRCARVADHNDFEDVSDA